MTRSFLDSLFPKNYDFYGMLTRQATLTCLGIGAFSTWLTQPTAANRQVLEGLANDADDVRMRLEEQLVNAFTTPFDREDVYTFSVRMDRILEAGKAAMLAMEAYAVTADEHILAMVRQLVLGAEALAKGTAMLENKPKQAEEEIEKMRKAYLAVQEEYRVSLAAAFQGKTALEAMKVREVYSEIREAANVFDLVVDVFHRIIVRLV
jgi:hypothetical protein